MLQEQTIPKETRINLPICRFVNLSICQLVEKKCFLKIGEIKRRGKYSSEFTMQTEIIWKKQFKQSSAFNITPIADSFNPNYFYVGGGAEDDYGRYTYLRRLSFATGEEGLFGFIK